MGLLRQEINLQRVLRLFVKCHNIDQTSVQRSDGGNRPLVRAHTPGNPCTKKSLRAAEGLKLVRDFQRDGTNRRAVHRVKSVGKRVSFSVKNDIHIALPIEQDVLGPEFPYPAKTQLSQPSREGTFRGILDGKLQEVDPFKNRWRGGIKEFNAFHRASGCS